MMAKSGIYCYGCEYYMDREPDGKYYCPRCGIREI